MRTYVFTFFCVHMIVMLAGAIVLSGNKYPRTSTHSAAEDVLRLALNASIAVWAAWVLWA